MSTQTASTAPAGMKDQGLTQGQAREFTIILPLKPGGAQKMRDRLKDYAHTDAHLMDKVATVHDLRHVIFDNDTRLLFCTTYDGGFEQYIRDFSTIIPEHIDAEFEHCEGYPGIHSLEVWDYIARHQIEAIAWYSAYPDAPVRTIWKALRVYKAFEDLLDEAQA